MLISSSERGSVSIDAAVFTRIAGLAATNCFGVKGMAVRSMTDGLVHLLRKEALSKGVLVTPHSDGSVTIDLHIILDQGVNLNALGASIISEVKYVVTTQTGVAVRAVNVFVDSVSIG
mgnify:CR=1 FL=1